jgi:hypothetical protein
VDVDIEVMGDDPLVDGMRVAVRLRLDFLVTDSARLLAAARQAFVDLHPGATGNAAEAAVTCAADVMFTVLEHDGVIGDAVDEVLAAREAHGLEREGWAAQVTFDDPQPLGRGRCLLGPLTDVFALPPLRPATDQS